MRALLINDTHEMSGRTLEKLRSVSVCVFFVRFFFELLCTTTFGPARVRKVFQKALPKRIKANTVTYKIYCRPVHRMHRINTYYIRPERRARHTLPRGA